MSSAGEEETVSVDADAVKSEKKPNELLRNNELTDDGRRSPLRFTSVSRTVQLDVVELLKQVLQWTPLYKPGLNRALLQAAKVGSLGCIKVLLSTGADIDTEDENGDTPFVLAMRARHFACMSALREAGCSTEIAKMSVAMAAPCDAAFVRLCHSLDVPVENEDWNAADAREVAMLLDDLHLDPFEGQYGQHDFEDSPFMYIVQEGRSEVLEMMYSRHPCIEKYSAEDRQVKLNLALFKAIRSHRLDNVRLLLNKLGAKTGSTDCHGRTPFVVACGHDESIARYLLDKGSDVAVADVDGLTALHWAACAGHAQLSVAILDSGLINVDCRANLGATPLMVACAARHFDVAELLLDVGADADAATPDGWCALHVAVRACAAAVVRLLLIKGGANPDPISSSLSHGGDCVPASTPLLIAISLNSVRMLRHLLDAGADINLVGLVSVAISISSTLSSGSESDDSTSTDSRQQLSCSPLQFAIASRAWDVAELLIRMGCDVSNVLSWLDSPSPPVAIPHDHAAYLRRLVNVMSSTPGKLSHLARCKLRSLLGHQLVSKLTQLNVSADIQQLVLFYDLFHAHSGSFEV